ncbi:MAG: hypothetical protein GXP53_09365, partial [Deltaproteobacteria bacterium]|nr:hypothetical protein [Deltaproteobacteria bacterium]
PVFSPDSKTIAYAYTKNHSWHMVINGKTSAGYQSLGKFYYSFDSRHYAYFAKDNDKWFCVVDGKKEKLTFKEGMNVFKFSPDSSRYTYAGIDEKGGKIIVGGKAGPLYKSVGEAYFSLDSKHVVYRARREKDGKWLTNLDGEIVSKAYNAIGKYYFSDDSSHLAYNALISLNKSVMVVDGTEQCSQNNFKIISHPCFSPDSKHLVYYIRVGKNIWKLMVDGKILPQVYAGFMKGTPIIFDTPSKFHTLGFRMPGPEFIRVEVEIPESSRLTTELKQEISR